MAFIDATHLAFVAADVRLAVGVICMVAASWHSPLWLWYGLRVCGKKHVGQMPLCLNLWQPSAAGCLGCPWV